MINPTSRSSDKEIQSNRHLKELNDNLTLERETRYNLESKHRQKRSRLLLEEIDPDEKSTLTAQQVKEIYEMTHRNSDTRITMQQRHAQEKKAFR